MNNAVRGNIERSFHARRKIAHKRISKVVIYDGVEYHSAIALARELKLSTPEYIYKIIPLGEFRGKEIHYK